MRIALLAILLLLPACRQNALPRYPDVTAAQAKQILADRAAAIHTISAQCELSLRRADGQSIELNGIIVIAPPDRLHLRTWKMSQAVLDLTVLPDGMWVETPGDPERAAQIIPASATAHGITKQLLWLTGGFFADQSLSIDSRGGSFIFKSNPPDGGAVVCEVERATLTANTFQVQDAAGKKQFELKLGDYREYSGIPWPMRLEARAPDGSRIKATLQDVRLNEPLTDQAFVPPAGARKRP